ncbi:DUF5131 family protein [Hahella sp. KA22]|uniref:DUF5131 family protein n=1 Tax=Hahella sp. KA22 TaxID=1628392 RepID=UPI000FDE39BB|nr:phage Gp37/Gp68 family protein [Hahella sp. KA22]AZZ92787.1 phage Gp37/Gp68 family protein [Hahella sp. KA22]QAY56161.1 DUF5131 family protein [Hahella sp. KA22]
MSDRTTIEWTGSTWNIITGCSFKSPGCTNCYAMKLAGSRLKNHPSRAGLTTLAKSGPVWNGQVRFNEQWADLPMRWTKPRMIFVCAHGDLFHESVPDEWILRVWEVMKEAKQHTFQVLTKRADRMHKLLNQLGPPLSNVWLGVSTENQETANNRIPKLLGTPAAVRWISAEPLLGALDLTNMPWRLNGVSGEVVKTMNALTGETTALDPLFNRREQLPSINWVVVGGESGQNARPMHPIWAESLRDQCQRANVPFFFKQWGSWAPRSKCWNAGTDFSSLDPQCRRWPHVIRLGEHGRNTRHLSHCDDKAGREVYMQNVGKKLSGRTLDGRTWDEFPEVKP